jgi:hypothetical protein
MSGNLYGLVIESLVAILLGLTIGYCIVLNKRLARLRSDESAMRGTIGELITATEFAERAINNLRNIARETNDTLGEGLRAAREVTRHLDDQVERGEAVLERIVKIADVAESARQPQKPTAAKVEPIASARAPSRTVEAAQALALRAKILASSGKAA